MFLQKEKNKIMNKLIVILFVVSALFSCKQQEQTQQAVTAKAKVSITKLEYGYIPDILHLTGKTIYLNKSNLIAPISGYVIKVNIQQGDNVKKDDVLFEMKTSEAYFIQTSDNAVNSDYGTVKVYAPVTGRVVSINVMNKDVFADKGSVMCVLMSSDDLKIQVEVPFEFIKWAQPGKKCKIILPDETQITGTLSKALPQVNESSQTTKVLANVNTNKFLPENLLVQALIDKGNKKQTQILPQSCLQTDALMTKYWVMKVINDSVAVRVYIKTGKQNHEKFEILSPVFSPDDMFVKEGAYGLGDTALISIN